jgi:hypothetical protein
MKWVNNFKIEIARNDEMNIIEFLRNASSNTFISTQGLEIEAVLNNDVYCYDAERIDNRSFLRENTDQIIQLFIIKYNEYVTRLMEDLENGVESTNENMVNEPIIIVPYDPNSIKVTQGRFSLKEIYEMITGTKDDEPILDLSPDFQRNFVWDGTRKSRLIESILLKIPLPVFYFARDNEGKYQVVDGVQRLSVIKEFFSNGFKLRNLEYWGEECNERYFQKESKVSLHPKFVRGLKSYQIDCNIIEPDTPHKVKLDIFKRLNTGGKSLNNQEIRNAILKKESRIFIKRLAESNEFRAATNYSIKPTRMMDQELVIRFIGFYFIYKQPNLFPNLIYNGVMNDFLDNVVEILNTEYKKVPFDIIEKDFFLSMKNALIMFEDYAFRKLEDDFRDCSKNMINKSLFTTFSVLLSNYNYALVKKKGNILDDFARRLFMDKDLNYSITYGSNDRVRINTTFIHIKRYLESMYGG